MLDRDPKLTRADDDTKNADGSFSLYAISVYFAAIAKIHQDVAFDMRRTINDKEELLSTFMGRSGIGIS